MQRPARARTLPRDADRARVRVLVHVLQRLLEDAVHRELVLRRELGGRRVERADDLDAAARLPLGGVVAHRFREAELGELRWAEVVDHRAHRVERRAELSAQRAELAAERLP